MHHTTSYIAKRQVAGRQSDRGAIGVDLLRRVAIGVAVLVLIALAIWALRNMMSHGGHDGPKRQIAKIAVLPDTPPPPPPPPPKERKEDTPKQEQQRSQPTPENQPKPQANEQIKMEGQAGNGPSAFQSGPVTQEYKGGTPGQGGSGGTGAAVDRAAERLYAGTVRQLLRDEIERQLSPDANEIQANFSVWVAADGRIGRWEIDPGAPNSEDLKKALTRCADTLRLPAPNAVTQPMRFKLTLRANG